MPEIGGTESAYRRAMWLLLVVNVLVPAFVIFQRNGSHLSDAATIWVGWISAAMLTAMLAGGTYYRQPGDRRKILKKVVLTSLALVVLSGLVTTIFIKASPSDNYLEVALSRTPLGEIRPDRKRLLVELIRQSKAASDENSRLANSMKPISPALYSVESFASKAEMESTSSQLKQAYKIDQAYAAAKHQVRQDFHEKMLRVDPGYLLEFESKIQQDDTIESSIEAEEKQWVESVFSLYAYAEAHANGISVDASGHLSIASEDVKKSLLQQIDASTVLKQAMMSDRAKAVKNQHSLQEAMGLKHPN
jgi:hypothetical protein